jgi:hypothetical protein
LLKGTAERLTQPGKIAIVYSQPREAEEYRQYLDYLRTKGYITDEVEDVDLEDLQGAYGLKALRVTVHMQAELPRQRTTSRGIGCVGTSLTPQPTSEKEWEEHEQFVVLPSVP